MAATKILPAYLHVSAIGFAAAFGGGGAAILPFAIGALAQTKGVSIIQPVIWLTLLYCSSCGCASRHFRRYLLVVRVKL
ncbi:hypothetical protein CC80DRAFT_581612 [Byssothecium circinans]|uniref:Uncharacterized protein n=1 Tax=Byssothecium circinans TaxID=147558 RepID=A0A6A5TA83_9PLEO|nr:hypothetical protein CC80DRAFT_581612 [Byssothecium circinans]